MDNPRYTPSELASIIGTTRKKSQVDWLSARNWRFDLDVNGRPIVFRDYALSKLGAIHSTRTNVFDSTQRPRFELLVP
jgi:hypothetical protein